MLPCGGDAGEARGAISALALRLDDRTGAARDLRGAISAAIVDDDDGVDVHAQAMYDRADRGLLVERGKNGDDLHWTVMSTETRSLTMHPSLETTSEYVYFPGAFGAATLARHTPSG